MLRDTAVCGCSSCALFFLLISAASFPGKSQWLKIHWKVISTEKVVMMSLTALLGFSIVGRQIFLFSRVYDFASVKISMFLWLLHLSFTPHDLEISLQVLTGYSMHTQNSALFVSFEANSSVQNTSQTQSHVLKKRDHLLLKIQKCKFSLYVIYMSFF